MEILMNTQINEYNPQRKEEFDNHCKTLMEVAIIKALAENNANMFRKVC